MATTTTTTVEALGLLEPAVWTPLYPGSLYNPASFRSMTPEGFVYDPVFPFGSTEEGFLCDEHGFRVEMEEEDVAYDIASFCATVKLLQDGATPLGNEVIDVEEVPDDDDDVLEEAVFAACFGHIIDSVEQLLEDDDEHTSSLKTKVSSTS